MGDLSCDHQRLQCSVLRVLSCLYLCVNQDIFPFDFIFLGITCLPYSSVHPTSLCSRGKFDTLHNLQSEVELRVCTMAARRDLKCFMYVRNCLQKSTSLCQEMDEVCYSLISTALVIEILTNILSRRDDVRAVVFQMRVRIPLSVSLVFTARYLYLPFRHQRIFLWESSEFIPCGCDGVQIPQNM